MRVVLLCALLSLAVATPWNRLATPPTIDNGDNLWYVSQTGPAPGRNTVTALNVKDVRTGLTWTAATSGAAGAPFDAPYAGCYYFYNKTDATTYTLIQGPDCTMYSEYNATGHPRHNPVSVALQTSGGDASTFGTSEGVYGFTLRFNVDAGYAGVAFEFLNLNVEGGDFTNADTRCGVSYDNLTPSSTVDGKGVVVPSPHSYNSVTYYIQRLADGASSATIAANGQWIVAPRSYTDASSRAIVTYAIADFNNALTNCGWKRDETNANTTVFNAQIRITTAQQGRNIRGLLLSSYKETVVKIGIAFNTAVNASSPNLDIQSPIVNLYQITKQVFDPVTNKAYLLLYTSSQGPYQLIAESALCDTANDGGTGCSTWTAGAGNGLQQNLTKIGLDYLAAGEDVTNLKLAGNAAGFTAGGKNASGSWAECYTIADTPTVSAYGNGVLPSNYPVCGQYWSIRLNPKVDCGNLFTNPLSSTLNGAWVLSFKVTCHSSYLGACATPQVNTITIRFNTASDNFCPRIVDTVSATAALTTFDDQARTNSQDQFVWGTTSYFTATVTSTIGIQSLFTEEIAITNGGAENNAAYSTTVAGVYLPPVETSSRPRQIIYANGFNFTGNEVVAANYFLSSTIEASSGASSCAASRSGQNTKRNGAAAGTYYASTDGTNGFFGTTCFFAGNTGAIEDYSLEQYTLDNAASPVLTARNYFQWRWNEAVSNATGDFAQTTQIRWDGRIQYDDRATKNVLSAWIVPHGRIAADSGASASVSRLTTGAPSNAAPSAEVVSTTTIAVAAAAVAAVAVMAVVAAVVLRQRNAKAESETNLESVTLGSTSSIQQA